MTKGGMRVAVIATSIDNSLEAFNLLYTSRKRNKVTNDAISYFDDRGV
jgi:hypothetical protein